MGHGLGWHVRLLRPLLALKWPPKWLILGLFWGLSGGAGEGFRSQVMAGKWVQKVLILDTLWETT